MPDPVAHKHRTPQRNYYLYTQVIWKPCKKGGDTRHHIIFYNMTISSSLHVVVLYHFHSLQHKTTFFLHNNHISLFSLPASFFISSCPPWELYSESGFFWKKTSQRQQPASSKFPNSQQNKQPIFFLFVYVSSTPRLQLYFISVFSYKLPK